MRLISVRGLMFAALILFAGCGGRGQGNISGKVTYKGKPVCSGTVVICTPNAPAVAAEIKEDGTYKCLNVLVGEAKVGVVSPNDAAEARETASQKPGIAYEGPKFDAKKWFPIPAKYATYQGSPLSTSVKDGENTFDINLED